MRTVDKVWAPWKIQGLGLPAWNPPRILWPLLIYEVPMTVVEGFEQKVSSYLRRWLGLP